MKRPKLFALLIIVLNLSSCMSWDYENDSVDFNAQGVGLFIVCEGDFQFGNATLSYYDPEDKIVENEIFYKANSMKLGDVAQSMTIFNNKGWIVVNNSHVIFAIDPVTFKEIGRIENLPSPRYIHFINEEKAYVTQIWDNRIFIVNPKTYSIIGTITVDNMLLQSGSTEQMVSYGKYVFVNCWSYQNRLLKIDTETDEIVAEITVGIQPNSLVMDYQNRLWTMTDGGYEGSVYGYEAPSLYCIDPETLEILKKFDFELGDSPSEITINGDKTTLYWINDDIWKMNVDSPQLPQAPFIENINTKYYGLTVNPYNSEVYVADAIDYMQQGIIYRYNSTGGLVDKFYVGVVPGSFCWKQ